MSTELSVQNKKIKEFADAIEARLEKVKDIGTKPFKTSGQFKFSPVGIAIDIFKVADISTLIEIASFLLSKGAGYERAAKELGLQKYPEFKWLGYSVEHWVADLKQRIEVVNSSNEIYNLKKAQGELEKLFTEEDRREKALKNIAKLIGYSEENLGNS